MYISTLKNELKVFKADLAKKTTEVECLQQQFNMQKETNTQLFRELDCSMTNQRLSQVPSPAYVKSSAGLKSLLEQSLADDSLDPVLSGAIDAYQSKTWQKRVFK